MIAINPKFSSLEEEISTFFTQIHPPLTPLEVDPEAIKQLYLYRKHEATNTYRTATIVDNITTSLVQILATIVAQVSNPDDPPEDSLFLRLGTVKSDPEKPNNIVKSDIESIQTLWVDLDYAEGTKPMHPPVDNFFLPPSMIIDSGNGYHLYWLLDKPETDLIQVETCNKLLEKLWPDADKTSDVTRVLRIPGTVNPKDPNNLKRCSLLPPTLGHYQRYTFKQVQSTLTSGANVQAIFEAPYPTDEDRSLNDTRRFRTLHTIYNYTPELVDNLLSYYGDCQLAAKHTGRTNGLAYIHNQWPQETIAPLSSITFGASNKNTIKPVRPANKPPVNAPNKPPARLVEAKGNTTTLDAEIAYLQSQGSAADASQAIDTSMLIKAFSEYPNISIHELSTIWQVDKSFLPVLTYDQEPAIGVYTVNEIKTSLGKEYVPGNIVIPFIIIPRSNIKDEDDNWIGQYCDCYYTPNDFESIFIPVQYLQGAKTNDAYVSFFDKFEHLSIPNQIRSKMIGVFMRAWLLRIEHFIPKRTLSTTPQALSRGIYYNDLAKRKCYVHKETSFVANLLEEDNLHNKIELRPTVFPVIENSQVEDKMIIGDLNLYNTYQDAPVMENKRAYTACQYLDEIWSINPKVTTLTSFGYLYATPYKHELNSDLHLHFPYLHLVGPAKTGKSDWAILMKYLLGLDTDKMHAGSDIARSGFRVRKAMARSLSSPAFIEELPTGKVGQVFVEALKESYEASAEVFRGKADQTINRMPLCRPVILTSNLNIIDEAAKSRSLSLYVSRVHHKKGGAKKFNLWLRSKKAREDILHFGTQYTFWTLTQKADPIWEEAQQLVNTYVEAMYDLVPVEVIADLFDGRSQHNVTIAIFGLLSFRKFLLEYIKLPDSQLPKLLQVLDNETVGAIYQYGTTYESLMAGKQSKREENLYEPINIIKDMVDNALVHFDSVPTMGSGKGINISFTETIRPLAPTFYTNKSKDGSTLSIHLKSALEWYIKKQRTLGAEISAEVYLSIRTGLTYFIEENPTVFPPQTKKRVTNLNHVKKKLQADLNNLDTSQPNYATTKLALEAQLRQHQEAPILTMQTINLAELGTL